MNLEREKKENIVFITGAHKTATSTLVGILNCHPNIFILYETLLIHGLPSKYGIRFLEKYPNARYLFRYESKPELLYSQLQKFLKDNGYNFEIIGDKLPSLDSNLLDAIKNLKVIFTVRDIRTWLCKNSIIKIYSNEQDIVPIAIDYCSYFLKSFLLTDILHIRMEDLIHKNSKTIKKIGTFLNINMTTYLNDWWKKIDNFKPNHPKYFLRWQKGHPSSKIKPENEDTVVNLNLSPFWDSLLPIFDKYYKQIDNLFTTDEIYYDIKLLNSLIKYSPISLSKAYKSYRTIPIVKKNSKNSRLKIGLIDKLFNLIISLKKYVLK